MAGQPPEDGEAKKQRRRECQLDGLEVSAALVSTGVVASLCLFLSYFLHARFQSTNALSDALAQFRQFLRTKNQQGNKKITSKCIG